MGRWAVKNIAITVWVGARPYTSGGVRNLADLLRWLRAVTQDIRAEHGRGAEIKITITGQS